jgi:hypothetical protein
MNLELKHLSPYFPYKLKVFFNNKIIELEELYMDTNLVGLKTEDFDSMCISYDKLKLILRPLSDLTKEINIKNKKFVPALVLWNVSAKEEEDFEIYGEIPDFWKTIMNLDFSNDLPYRDMKKLFEWHFDVFGLIEKNLAININKL